ncbi:MAG: hypothetical protein KBT07_01520 [Clostridiales bacterium]|nr:hypothetical protein [Candidatus Scatonaster coprocaballi]
MQKQNDRLIRKILISYAITFIVINFADSLTMIVDGMVVSRGLGSTALAAIGLADPSFKFVSLFTGVLAAGLQSLCAQAMGSGDKERVNGIFSAGMVVTLSVTVVLVFLGFLFTGKLCLLFGAEDDPDLYHNLFQYLRGWFTGIPGYMLFFVLSPLVTLDGNKKNVAIATIVQSIVNVVGDILAVFVLDAGVYGVGFATGLSFNVSAVILMLNFVRKRSVFKPFSQRPLMKLLPKTMNIGLPMITQQVCKILAPLLINRTIIAIGGSLAMSAMSVKAGVMGFCVIIGHGIAESVGLMTQILYSEKDETSLKQTVKIALRLHLILNTVMMVLLFALAGGVSSLYFTHGTLEWIYARRAVRCLALFLLMNGCNTILIKYLHGARKMMPVHIMTLLQRMASLTVSTMVLGNLFGINGLFAAIPVSEALVLIGYVVFILVRNHKQDFWSAILMIPDGFGYNSENSFSVSISTVEEAVAVSEQIESFCIAHQVDKRQSFFSARCMEELSTNIILNGFTADDKKHHCDIRVMIDPDGVVLRLRDDCPYFNIRERYDSLAEDDIDAGVWIRMVFALAKDIRYINIFNTNTLVIRM